MRPLEAKVERDVKKWAKMHKGEFLYWKFVVPGMSGVPDRICLFKGGRVVFFELKRPGGKTRKLQDWIHRKLRAFGFPCHVFDNAPDAVKCLEEYINELHTRNTEVGAARLPTAGDEDDGGTGSSGAIS